MNTSNKMRELTLSEIDCVSGAGSDWVYEAGRLFMKGATAWGRQAADNASRGIPMWLP